MKRARRVNRNQMLTDDELAARLALLRDVERRTAEGELTEAERVAELQDAFPAHEIRTAGSNSVVFRRTGQVQQEGER